MFRQTNRFTPFRFGKQTGLRNFVSATQTGLHHFVSANKSVYTILFRQTNRFTPFCFGTQTGLHNCFGKQTGLHHFVSAYKPVYTILFRQTNRFTPFCLHSKTFCLLQTSRWRSCQPPNAARPKAWVILDKLPDHQHVSNIATVSSNHLLRCTFRRMKTNTKTVFLRFLSPAKKKKKKIL